MILLDQIVEVLATPDFDEIPLGVFPTEQSESRVALLVAIERDLTRPPRQARGQRFAEERLRSGNAAIRTEQEVHRLAVLVDSPVEIIPLALNVDIRFVHTPGGIHRPCEAVPSLLEFRHVTDHPPMNRRVRHDDAPLRLHRHQIPVAQPVSDVPAHALFDDLGIEAAAAVNGISDYGPGNFGISWTPELYDNAP